MAWCDEPDDDAAPMKSARSGIALAVASFRAADALRISGLDYFKHNKHVKHITFK